MIRNGEYWRHIYKLEAVKPHFINQVDQGRLLLSVIGGILYMEALNEKTATKLHQNETISLLHRFKVYIIQLSEQTLH